MKFYISLICTCVFIGLLASCSGENASKGEGKHLETPEADPVLDRAQNIFYGMPSPLELITLIKSAGGDYNETLLHDPQMSMQYQTRLKRALNMGIYGADLSYASVYDQQQMIIKNLSACKRLGEALGITEAFNAEIIERANISLNNRDSMLSILTDMYWETNSQLASEDRNQLSIVIMASGWVEGLYIGSHIADLNNPDPEIVERLMEQKYTAMQLREMIALEEGDLMIDEVLTLIDDLLNFYGALTITEENTVVRKDQSSGVSEISGIKEVNHNPGDIKILQEITARTRAEMIAL